METREELLVQALSLDAQPQWGPQPPQIHYGPRFLRYNRVEGLGIGAAVDQKLGAGITVQFAARLGLADLEPNVELSLRRSDMQREVRVGAYNRLAVVGDYGNPPSLGSAVSALLFGRDEGYYYRTTGAELVLARELLAGQLRIEWRLFAEQQRTAATETDFALGRRMRDSNVTALRGRYAGGSMRLVHTLGDDPRKLRLLTDLRLEGAAADNGSVFGYGRAALDLTAMRPLGRVSGALSASVGSSVGALPAQRRWYLGGTQTVRGQRFGIAGGDAFWLERAELGTTVALVRPVVFGDLGWAGDRTRLDAMGRPFSSVGVGASFLDGLLRLDLARGIQPEERIRIALYLERRF